MNADYKKPKLPVIDSIAWNNLTWTDISSPTTTETGVLARTYNFHPLALEDSLRSQLSKVDDYGSYLLLVLHFPVIIPETRAIKSTWLSAFIGRNYLITLHDEFKTPTGLFNTAQTNKEVIEVYKDSDFVLVTNRINRIVQTLTIVSSIFLPFLVVSILYGMNVILPGGLQSSNPASFGILLGIMFIISGGMLYFFHRRHWI